MKTEQCDRGGDGLSQRAFQGMASLLRVCRPEVRIGAGYKENQRKRVSRRAKEMRQEKPERLYTTARCRAPAEGAVVP